MTVIAPWLTHSRLLPLTVFALLVRAVTFGNPIVNVDEEFYYTVGHFMARGTIPYVDIWDRKPFGLFLLYLPAGLFDPPTGIYVYQGIALVATVSTASIIKRVADHEGWQRGGTFAALLYIASLNLADGQGGQAPVFYNLLTAAAALLIVSATDLPPDRRRRFGIGAMALIGLALQIKYSVVFEGIGFGLWLLWQERHQRPRLRTTIAYAAFLCAAALLPTAVVGAAYWLAGHDHAFVYANFLSIIARRPDPIGESLGNLAVAAALLAPLLLLAMIGARRQSRPPRFVLYWLAASVFGFLIFGSWFNHYTLPVMLPAAIAAAAFIADRRFGRTIAAILIVLIVAAGQYILQAERQTRGTPAQFATLASAIGRGPGALYVYQGSAILYPVTGRPALTRYLFPTHLMLLREQGAVGIDQGAEIDRIFDRRPEIVVLQSPEDGEDPAKRALAMRRLRTDGYRRYARLPLGNKLFDLFRRPTAKT
ncbi:glycosyltransferase family 39 protein [Sphingomonas aliaeris]|uniref:Glycosyltransferase family 39 protein n=1 Tax=Sphingomonas aliaeris TaxID=2759526 RepID=A0A974NXB5_9SPHN|nr:glycosyltransferase family 39 protein [Sphingomonas aliaeris]QQV78601.1 glycosyltransferase family 39 protein [Sphingomonas aliaeris]